MSDVIICSECSSSAEKKVISEDPLKWRFVCGSCGWSSKIHEKNELPDEKVVKKTVKNFKIKDKIKFIRTCALPKNIIFDFSYMCHRAKYHKDVQEKGFQVNLWKHIVLSGLIKGIELFKPESIFIMCDSKSWRNGIFPNYKWKRKQQRRESGEDYDEFFKEIDMFIEEIRKNFPYYVVKVDNAEADDIIAVYCTENSKNCVNILISSDKDFGQLYKFSNFFQFDPIVETLLQPDDYKFDLFKLCVKGDSSDSIPNFLMPDNTFVDKIRQKPIREASIKEWFQIVKQGKNFTDNKIQVEGFKRNCKLIRFEYIPERIKTNISNTLKLSEKHGSKIKMLQYFIRKDFKYLKDELEKGRI